MLIGLGVSVAWKLGRGIEEQPRAFASVPWVVLAISVILLALLALKRRLGPGEAVAIGAAAAVTLAAWGVVQLGSMNQVYELVPAFLVAALSAPVISRLVPIEPSGTG